MARSPEKKKKGLEVVGEVEVFCKTPPALLDRVFRYLWTRPFSEVHEKMGPLSQALKDKATQAVPEQGPEHNGKGSPKG